MNRIKKTAIKKLLVTFFIILLLLLTGCFERAPIKEETMLPSLEASDIDRLELDQLSWFTHELDPTTGVLQNHVLPNPLDEHILTAEILLSYSQTNESYQHILNNTLETLIGQYEKEKTNLSLVTKAELLNLLTQPGITIDVTSIMTELVSEILSYQLENNTFNTTPILSIEASYILQAIVSYEQAVDNESMSLLVDQTVNSYQFLNNEVLAQDNETEEYQDYILHYFTKAFRTYYNENMMRSDIIELIINMNTVLYDLQETKEKNTLGQYQSFTTRNPNQYHIETLMQVMNAYTVSKNLETTTNDSTLKQSVILGLIYLKNTISENASISLQTINQLELILLLHQAQNLFTEENYTYLWDSTNQLLIEGRNLETSPTLWMLLTIGVMGSIGLLSLLYVIIQLYYKNKEH